MNADSKHNDVMVAIGRINECVSRLRVVASSDGLRGMQMNWAVIDEIEKLVGPSDELDTLFNWLGWLESDLEAE